MPQREPETLGTVLLKDHRSFDWRKFRGSYTDNDGAYPLLTDSSKTAPDYPATFASADMLR